VVTVAGDIAGASITSNEVGPFVVDMTFDLGRGGGGSPQEAVREPQQFAVLRAAHHKLLGRLIKEKTRAACQKIRFWPVEPERKFGFPSGY
jgi:hypothetical protein